MTLESPPVQKSAITIGNFDGVHKGHAALISEINNYRDSQPMGSCKSIVVTFSPHPIEVLKPEITVEKICSLEERISLIKELGVDEVKVIPFSKDFALKSAKSFFEDILIKGLNPAFICVGHNFYFGHNREGTPKNLLAWAKQRGIDARSITPVKTSETNVSSSLIRAALKKGDIKNANLMLGKAFKLSGTVIKGKQKGRTINVPTANISFQKDRCIPAEGVYATLATTDDGKTFQAVSNIGVRPTVGDNLPKSIETHLLDFDEELYGKIITVQFIDRLRGEKRFESLDKLRKQIQIDISDSRTILSSI